MNKYRKKLSRILTNGYGVRSGVYAAIDPDIKMQMDIYGEYSPIFNGSETEETYRRLLCVDMMSDESPNEDVIARDLFSGVGGIKHDPILGYYSDLYAGYVVEGDYRESGSSGGFTTWILAELYKNKKIDGVIHVCEVDPRKNDGILFRYKISHSLGDIKAGAKSRYYPVELSEVLKTVKTRPGRYAIVGIPEFITELRLLMNNDYIFRDRIKYTLGLICGHQKTANYSAALAWQHGINPGKLLSIDFRVKQPNSTAMDYLHRFTGLVKGKKTSFLKSHSELFAESWSLGFFKSKFSDFTDNAFNELADVALGDAWLPKYNVDGRGNNIVIVRNRDIAALINRGIKDKRLKVDEVDAQIVRDSQVGLIHHTRDELPHRLSRQKRRGAWVPAKRTKPSRQQFYSRKKVQNMRYKISRNSHRIYVKALKRDNWRYFETHMSRAVRHYDIIHKILRWRESYTITRRKLQPRARVRKVAVYLKDPHGIRAQLKKFKKKISYKISWHKYKRADGVILTLNGYFNYGNIVQRYAMQEILHQKGYNFISYENSPTGVSWDDPERFTSTKEFVERNIKRKNFDIRDNFPCYIVGSDQVWRNWGYTDEKKDLGYFFLDFAHSSKVARIAYAASMGKDEITEDLMSSEFTEYAQSLVEKFDAISMREISGVDLLQKTWGVKSRQVVDPTFLLGVDDYSKLIKASKRKLEPTKPVFIYILATEDPKTEYIRKVVQYLNKKVDGFYMDKLRVLPPVEQWLKGFRDAELVITDSFHGMVLSIINRTPFLILENEVGGVARITDLLEELGLENRLVKKSDMGRLNLAKLGPIDWGAVGEKLEVMRNMSIIWLMNTLKTSTVPEYDGLDMPVTLRSTFITGAKFCYRALRRVRALVLRIAGRFVQNIIKRAIRVVWFRVFNRKRLINNDVFDSEQPFVSVVSPYYNSAATIEETVGSVLNQTYQNFKYIIIDDGSDAEQSKILDTIKHPKVKVVHLKHNIGNGSPAAARNLGILMSKGKYVVCLDSDDMLEPTYLEKGLLVLEARPWIDIFSVDTKAFGKIEENWDYTPYNPRHLIGNNMLITASMFKRSAWEGVGGYKENIGYEDWELWINMAEHGHFAYNIHERLFKYRTAEVSRFLEDRKKQESILKDIYALHRTYRQKIRSLRLRARWVSKSVNPKTALINLSNSLHYQINHNQKPNILVAVPWMTFGGAETLIVNFCNEIKDTFNLSFVTGLQSEHEWEYKFRGISERIYHLANLFDNKSLYVEFISNYILTRNIMALHIIHTSFMTGIIPELKKRHPTLKIVFTVFNDRAEHFNNSVSEQDHIDAYSTDNSSVANHYAKKLQNDKTATVIPNGINSSDVFNPTLLDRTRQRKALGLKVDDLAVFFIGRLSEEKNPDVFLEVVKNIVKTNKQTSIKFFVIGDGPMRPDVVRQIKKIGSKNVTYLGYQSEIAEYLSAADIFVLPSSIEGFPLSILEAMAMRVAVISSDVGAVSEVIESGVDGFVVMPGSAKEITETILKLRNDPELLATIKLNARQKIDKKYSNKLLGQNYTKLYKGLLK